MISRVGVGGVAAESVVALDEHPGTSAGSHPRRQVAQIDLTREGGFGPDAEIVRARHRRQARAQQEAQRLKRAAEPAPIALADYEVDLAPSPWALSVAPVGSDDPFAEESGREDFERE